MVAPIVRCRVAGSGSSLRYARAPMSRKRYTTGAAGTLPMLEELARDVTGWPAHAVEYFELLGWTQGAQSPALPFAAHPRHPFVERMDRLNGAFDEIAHTVDVRPISQDEGYTTFVTSASSLASHRLRA
ncbi:MAG: hypothetical protein U1E67_12935 [Hyphomicrobiales bacterium]